MRLLPEDSRRALGRSAWLVSLVGWGMLVAGAGGFVLPAYCLAAGSGGAPGGQAVAAAAAFNPPGALAAGWALMLVAMMPPLLVAPLTHVWDRSGARRRGRAIALFLAGYGLVWIPVGTALAGFALAVRAATGGVAIPLGAAMLAALVWQASPWKQACLNRCHFLPRLSAFGWAADRDALRFGAMQGLWCSASCGLLMALPLFLPAGHLAAMAVVAVYMFAERLEPARPCRWRLAPPARGPSLALAMIRQAATGGAR